MTTQAFNQESAKEMGSRIKGLVVESAHIEESDSSTENDSLIIKFQGGHKLKIGYDWVYSLEVCRQGKMKEPEGGFATGGIVEGPAGGYLCALNRPSLIIPIPSPLPVSKQMNVLKCSPCFIKKDEPVKKE